MEIASSKIVEHDFDPLMVEQIDTLRTIRLNLAETMLHNLNGTFRELIDRGLASSKTDVEEVREELRAKISILKSRIEHPNVIYSDEMELYLHLLESTEAIGED